MGQRVMIAMMLISGPELLIADEPTSALDVTVRMEVLGLLDELIASRGLGLVFISHDLNLVRRFCDRVIIMYSGRIVETLAAVELDPDATELDEGVRFPLCRANALEQLFTSTGFKDVAGTAIDIPTPFASFDDYWRPFLGGQGPAPAYAMSLDETARIHLRDRIRQRLPIAADGSIALTARAWAVRARGAQ